MVQVIGAFVEGLITIAIPAIPSKPFREVSSSNRPRREARKDVEATILAHSTLEERGRNLLPRCHTVRP